MTSEIVLTCARRLSYCHRYQPGDTSWRPPVLNLPSRNSNATPNRRRSQMLCISLERFPDRVGKLLLVAIGILMISAFSPTTLRAQRARGQEEDKPVFANFKGVQIGMSADEARKKLGSPKDKGDDLDLYVFNDTQAVQVYYDKAKTVSAISIDFMDGGADAPA